MDPRDDVEAGQAMGRQHPKSGDGRSAIDACGRKMILGTFVSPPSKRNYLPPESNWVSGNVDVVVFLSREGPGRNVVPSVHSRSLRQQSNSPTCCILRK
jgi:hypothetical protein